MFCTNLESISFIGESQLHTIGKCAFYGCRKLQLFDFPHVLKRIEEKAFNFRNESNIIDLSKTQLEYLGEYSLGNDIKTTLIFPPTL